MAPTTIAGQVTTTSSYGWDCSLVSMPLDLPKTIATLSGGSLCCSSFGGYTAKYQYCQEGIEEGISIKFKKPDCFFLCQHFIYLPDKLGLVAC